ncbi:Outer membrane protein assembly factor YaeT [Chitinispirillum alkaliphilum]|nr:Outer membrane protein assembly factor YaeT [Chitinispirillum alkaliphilum]
MKQTIFLTVFLCFNSLLPLPIKAEQRWNVGDVEFRGNQAISDEELLANMNTTPPRFLLREEYSFSKLDRDINNIELVYKTRGYPFVTVSIYDIERDTATMSVNITLNIDEGPLVLIDSVIIKNSDVLSLPEVYSIISLRPQMPLDTLGVYNDARTIRDSLRAKGYLQARVESRQTIDKQDTTAIITHTISEGPIIIVDEIFITGLKRVDTNVVRRELTFKKGTVLTSSEIIESIRRTYSTALFNVIRIIPDTSLNRPDLCTAVVAVTVDIREAPFASAQAGFGYDTEEKFHSSLIASYRNIIGRGHRLSLLGRASQRIRNVQLTYSWPWFMSYPVWADFSVYAERRREEEFSGDFEGGIIAFRTQVTPNLMYNFWTRIERTEWTVEPPPDQLFPLMPISPNHVIAAALTYDTRYELINPGFSSLTFIQAEVAGLSGFGNQYVKLQFDIRCYYPIAERLTFSSALLTGYAFPYGDNVTVPPRERFRAGETPIRDVRGYLLEEVTPLDDDEFLRGGNFIVILNLAEIEYSVTQGLSAAVFVDAGNVWSSVDDFSMETLRWSAGAGLRVALPIGLTRLDFAVPFFPEIIFPGRFHLSLGLPF